MRIYNIQKKTYVDFKNVVRAGGACYSKQTGELWSVNIKQEIIINRTV